MPIILAFFIGTDQSILNQVRYLEPFPLTGLRLRARSLRPSKTDFLHNFSPILKATQLLSHLANFFINWRQKWKIFVCKICFAGSQSRARTSQASQWGGL